MKEKTTDIGVIIGRFQLHQLHSEHIKLIASVLSKHEKVILFLGTTVATSTKKNPLDFITRKAMIEEAFEFGISAILPLPDCRSNSIWSNQIDTKIREIFPSGSVTLYGSRDSFIPYYSGIFNTCELVPDVFVSATDIREKVAKKIIRSSDFRAGVIYSVFSQYPVVFSTIDLIITDGKGNILLGRKPNESQWRFIGGFVDPSDDSDIAACKREGREETGLELDDFRFICSHKVKDWRYENTPEKSIMTRLYECKYIFGSPQPSDDIAELKWFKIEVLEDPSFNNIVPEHKELLMKYFIFK